MKKLLCLLLFSSITSASDLKTATQYSLAGDYAASEAILSKFPKSDHSHTYYFYRLVNSFSLNKKTESIKYADIIQNLFSDDVPQRYRDLAIIMKAEASTWKDNPDDLFDIAREMKKVGDRLKNNKGGEETRKIQKNIENRLKKMIDDIENPKNKNNNKDDKDKDDKDDKDNKGKDEEQQGKKEPGNKTEILPPPDVHNQTEKGTGEIEKKRIKELAAIWGKLPPKERAIAIRELTKKLPPKDKAIIERYLKELQIRSGIKRNY